MKPDKVRMDRIATEMQSLRDEYEDVGLTDAERAAEIAERLEELGRLLSRLRNPRDGRGR